MAYTPTNWSTGDTITASALNKLENGVANAGGGKYDAYDYVIKQVDNGTLTVEKGTWSAVYDALQAMEPVTGLYVYNQTPGEYYDTECLFAPMISTVYYSSADMIICKAVSVDYSGVSWFRIEWDSDGAIRKYTS